MRDKSRLSEANIPPVTLDAAPNDAEEEQVPYAAARESEAPADNIAPVDNSADNLAKVWNFISNSPIQFHQGMICFATFSSFNLNRVSLS
ncbi:hypothetical protein PS1_040303 [Malus domestica]